MKKHLSNWHVSGRLQRIFTFLVFMVLALLSALLLEFICTGLILGGVGSVLSEYVPPDHIGQVKAKLAAAGSGFGTQLFLIILFMAATGWGLLKLSTRFHLVGSVTLTKALRFTDAMDRLGLVHE
ncbi:MAG: hypothetical protein LBT47_07415 [Deltaproteobacteria bacterium]|jgi:hypothetical protein|nr:hypothetical protein [Deltaproteobacteria bacterium]